LWSPGARGRRPVAWAFVIALLPIAFVGLVQLIPLAPATVATISPATDQFLREYDVAYQFAATTGAADYRHPLSIKPAGTWLALAALGSLGLLLVGTARALGHRSLRTLASGLVFVGFLVALVGIVQSGLYMHDPNPTLKVYGFWETINKDTYPFGPFVNRNHFAGWMLLALPVAIAYFCALVARGMRGVRPTFRDRLLWFSSSEASRVILVGLAVLVMGLSLVLTLSRSGTSCFLLALAISGWFVIRRQAAGSRRHISLAYVATVAVFSVGWAGLDAVMERFSNAPTDFWSRFEVWKDAWTMFLAFPWLGSGLNTFGTATVLYQSSLFQTHHVEAHNDYVPASEHDPDKSKRGRYRIADPFVRFWFRHVRRGWNRLETGQVDGVLRDVEADLDRLAAAAYEDLCRQLVEAGGLGPRRWSRVGRWWNRSDEMDVVGFADDGGLLAGEAKWSSRPVGVNVLDELRAKVERSGLAANARDVTFALFSRSGFTAALLTSSRARKDLVLVERLTPKSLRE